MMTFARLRFSAKRPRAMQDSQQSWPSSLTPLERDVARLVTRGLSNKEIAQMLETSPGTVRFQVHCVLKKLGVSKRSELLLQRG